ncbi:hypothetical protein [Bacillus sp. CGMCC 1.16541]|uniref:hypothetical protein n=1 Tax=Bacillus sp. CGMCC 1.16541 TaxID=2185143 RepID=UPI000D726EEE|nr:hypothetical protein [Bacillus sp. CGMCC 1.16541]
MNLKDELEKSSLEKITLTEEEKTRIRYRVRHSTTPKRYLKPVLISTFSVMIAIVLTFPIIQPNEQEEQAMDQISTGGSTHSAIPITEAQKKQYYQQYLNIVDKAMEQKSGISISVPPMEEFKESDWLSPEEYNEMVQDMVKSHLAAEREKIEAASSNLKPATTVDGETTKSTYLYFPDMLKEIEVTATFDTKYSTKRDRQVFLNVDNVSTQLASSPGAWEQSSYKTSLKDDNQTYLIQIEGVFTLNNLSFEKKFLIEFKCDKFGHIS